MEVFRVQKEVALANTAESSSQASLLKEGSAKAARLPHHLSSKHQPHSSDKTGKDRMTLVFGTQHLTR